MRMLYHLIFCLALLTSHVFGEELTSSTLPLKFYLPENYEMTVKGEENEAFFLAPKGFDIEKAANSKDHFQPAILGINFQYSTSFSEEIPQVIEGIKQQFPQGFEAKSTKWGDYSIVTMKVFIGLDVGYVAYVGLNDAEENGIMLSFLFSSEKEFGEGRAPNQQDLQFWEDFITKTEPLALAS